MSGCIDHCLRSRRGSFEKITMILPALPMSEARLTGRPRPTFGFIRTGSGEPAVEVAN
jgi:hypothetical protein